MATLPHMRFSFIPAALCLCASLSAAISVAAPSRPSPAQGQFTQTQLFAGLSAHHHWQQTHVVSLSDVRTYQVVNHKGKLLAEEVVAVDYASPSTENFKVTSAKGSEFIRHHVFRRLIAREAKRIRAGGDGDGLINPENYTLEMVGTDQLADSACLIVHATPKHKKTELFDGQIWIDSQNFAIVKISGRLAKNPSFWVKQVDFVRDYRKVDGFWLVSSEKVVSEVRIFGKETLTVDYDNYAVNAAP
ncbi:MAG: hypothetical protein WA369_11240 [Candidatus Acidiferrales bacterium]